MAEEKWTNEKKCTKCGSENIEYQGFSHALYIGGKISELKDHQFKCQQEDCKNIFSYRAKHP